MTTNLEDLDAIPAALRDRFAVAIRIDQPHPDAVVLLSEDLRHAALVGSLPDSSRRLSLRSFYAFDRLRSHLGPERAAHLVFGGERAQSVLDALRIRALE